jgi:glc operon protein GlcG
MDDSFLKSIDIAMMKAQTSAGLPFSTKQIGEIATKVPGIAFVPGIVTFEGGLPLMTADSKHIGSIGVSGASAEQDGTCAQAGLDAVKNDLK